MTTPTPARQPITVALDRRPPVPQLTGEEVLPGLAIVPWLDNENQLTGLVLAVHIASGAAVGGVQCVPCRRRNLHLLAGVDWTRTRDQARTDPAVKAADQADQEAADRCTTDHHQCAEGFCVPAPAGDDTPAHPTAAARAQAAAEQLPTVGRWAEADR